MRCNFKHKSGKIWECPDCKQTMKTPFNKPPVAMCLSPGGPCRHLGEPTGEKAQCHTCNGKVMVKLFSCDLLGTCTMTKKVDTAACCFGCEYKEPVSG